MNSIGVEEFARMIRGAAERVRGAETMLTQLDSATGDGDHGFTMARAMLRLEELTAETGHADLRSLLEAVAWALFDIDGGAVGPLLGSFFQGMADGSGQAWDVNGLVAAYESGLSQLQKQSRAQIGDKTMMDAWIPAVRAMRRAANDGCAITEVLQLAAAAAADGAASTANLTAHFGRARFLGERARGHQDPGATSVALLLHGFCDGLRPETAPAPASNQPAPMRQEKEI